MRKGTLILGAGGHGKVVADILQCCATRVVGFLDDDPALWGTRQFGLPVLGPIENHAWNHQSNGLIIGVGSIEARKQIVRRLGPRAEPLWRNAIHPRAVVARSARLGVGVTVAAGAVVNPDVVLGDHVIVNTGAGVDHDCIVAAFAHVGPGVYLAGGVHIGREVLVGIGATVIPGRHVGDGAVVGAGAVVTRDVPDNATVVGVPAQVRATAFAEC